MKVLVIRSTEIPICSWMSCIFVSLILCCYCPGWDILSGAVHKKLLFFWIFYLLKDLVNIQDDIFEDLSLNFVQS